ncbi:MAG: DNA polymerase I [Coriobacteriia bacterium]|nr:DNA polymerase I [Coriobacteriia bacterium]
MNNTEKKLLVIDGHSWMHRAFHAMRTPLTAPDGQPMGAVFGFFSMLSKALSLLGPDAVVVAFDEGKPTARIEVLAQYKIQRKPTDPDLKLQFPIIKELLAAMHVPIASVEHIEGDDILGTLSLQGEQLGMRVYLATSDRDAYQLITQRTSVITAGRGTEGPRIITPTDVVKRYRIAPEQVVDFLGLKGDLADNIPGVPGVGEKTAALLLKEYTSLDAVLAAAEAGEIKGKVGQSLAESREIAEISRQVATILRDIPLGIDLETLQFGSYNSADITGSFMRYGLRSPLGWMLKYGKQDQQQTDFVAAESDLQSESPASDSATVQERPLAASPYVGVVISSSGDTLFDNEQTLTLATLAAAADSSDDKFSNGVRTLRDTSIAVALAELLQSEQQLAAADIKALFSEVAPPDNTKDCSLDPKSLDATGYFDVRIAAYLLASHKTDFSLKMVALEYLGVDLDELPAKYFAEAGDTAADEHSKDDSSTASSKAHAAGEARLVAQLATILEERLQADDSLDLYRSIEVPLIAVLARMERAGITVDRKRLDELAAYGRDRVAELRAEVFELAGTADFNPDSPKQIAEILFDRLNLPVIKKTQKGRSTDAKVLAELAHHHPIAAKITEYREFTKLQNTYLDAFPRLIAADGRIHTSYNQAVAATGRLSSSHPNLQNIPVRTELGRRIREAFVPCCSDWKLVSVDYSQIELRVLAQLSNDPELIEAFNSGEDFHARTAARIFDLPLDQAADIDPGLRSKAKAVNFGIIYGQGPHGLSKSLEISYGEAKAIIDRYYASFPRVKAYLDETVAFARQHGFVTTYFGRKRHIPELLSLNRAVQAFGERTAMNLPMQGTAADLIKLAMIGVDARLRAENLQAKMLLQVHDELVFEAPAEECDQLCQLVTRVMTSVAPDFKVQLEVNVAVGDTWANAK